MSRAIATVTAGALSLFWAWTAAALTLPSGREATLNGTWTLETPAGKALLDSKGAPPPLLPEAKALYNKRRAQLAKGDTSFDPSVKCKPMGFPRVLWEGGPFDIQLQPRLVFFGYTWNRNHRTAQFAESSKLQIPRYYGTSAAHWEGDTLVIESGLFNANTLLDSSGLPHSEDMMLVERYRSLDNGSRLEVRVAIEDPNYYSKPWDVSFTYARVPNGRILEDVCQQRSPFYKELLKGR